MGETIKVRICVAVSADGSWVYTDEDVAGMSEHAVEKLTEWAFGDGAVKPIALYWIEAELPLPQKTTVQGKLVDALGGQKDG